MSVSTPGVAIDGVAQNTRASYTAELTILTTLFFMWGFLTCLNDILIPHLKAVFLLNYAEAMLVQLSFFAAYFIVSIPSGAIVERLGYKRGIVIGLITAGLGCLTFYPAAGMQSYPLFLVALFILASGITLLQVAANPYVAILGRPETASSRLNLTQAFNSLGTTIAPYFGALVILSVAVKGTREIQLMSPGQLTAYQLTQASAVQVPYLWLAAALLMIAAVFAFLKLPQVEAGSVPSDSDGGKHRASTRSSAWGYRHLVLGAVGIFVYVGAEVSIGSFLVNYIANPDVLGISAAQAGKYVSFYWGGAMVGRFIGSGVQRKVKPGTVLAFNAVFAAVLVVASMLSFGRIAMVSILLVGLFNSIMFPTIFTLAIDGLGKYTSQGSGILCMAIVGGAIIPVLQGILADRIGVHHAFLLPVLCYVYIIYYGLKGSRPVLSVHSQY